MRYLIVLMGLSLLRFALAQTPNGESMQTAYDLSPVFNNPPTSSSGLRIWGWSGRDSTRARANNHNLRSGPDVVWKVVLPVCLDSMDVHFAYHDDNEDAVFPDGHALFIINASSGDTVELLENSYDDYMFMWTLFNSGWVSLISGYPFNGPGTAYLRGYESSSLRSSGTGDGWGSPLTGDTIRLAAGDTLYFIYTHNSTPVGSVDSVYLELLFIQKVRPSLPPLNLSVNAGPLQVCMGELVGVEYAANDTTNDGRDPRAYWFGWITLLDGQNIGSGYASGTSSSGAGTFSYTTTSGNALSQGYVDYTEKWVVRGIYGHPLYPGHPYQPNAPSCEDTSLVSDTISYTVRMTVRPDPKVQYAGNDYGDGSTITVQPGSVSFSAVEALGLNSSLLSYAWILDGNSAGTSPTLNTTLSPGSHTLQLTIQNSPSNAASCDSSITVTLDVTTALSSASQSFKAYAEDNILYLLLPAKGPHHLRIYDIQGRLLHTTANLPGGVWHQLPAPAKGILILSLTGPEETATLRVRVE